MIETAGFEIKYHGDESVGMFPKEWTLTGHFDFVDETEYEIFVQELKSAFEIIIDTPIEVIPIKLK